MSETQIAKAERLSRPKGDDHWHQMIPQRASVIEKLQWFECSICGFRATEQYPTQIVQPPGRSAPEHARMVPYA